MAYYYYYAKFIRRFGPFYSALPRAAIENHTFYKEEKCE